MKKNSAIKYIVLGLAGGALAFSGYWVGTNNPAMDHSAVQSLQVQDGEKVDPKTGRPVLYWHDPMVPGQRFDKPGKSPFMDMQLVPVFADEGSEEGGVKISPTLQQNLGIRFAVVRKEETKESFELIGTTQFNESTAEVIQSRVTGYIERLHARSPMQRIGRGEPVATLFVPDWIAPQEEYLALKRVGNESLAAAARERMRALSIPDALIARAVRTDKAQHNLTLHSPVTGVVTDLEMREGAMVSPGMTIAKVAALNTVWLLAEVPESLANVVRPGMSVEAWVQGSAEQRHSGVVKEILPNVSPTTRTVQARLELNNKENTLTPGMLMRVRVGAEKSVPRLVVPTEAVIASGKRSVVLVADEANRIQPVVVTIGRELGDDTEILSGLNEGQKVVVSGQFLIDSEARLKSILPKFADKGTKHTGKEAHSSGHEKESAASGTPVYRGVGKVEEVTPDAFTLSHGPIPELQWGAMTMDFNKSKPEAFADIKVGQEVEFFFREGEDGYLLEKVAPIKGAKK